MKVIGKVEADTFLVQMTATEIARACGFAYSNERGFAALLRNGSIEVGIELDGANAYAISDSVDRHVRAVKDAVEHYEAAVKLLQANGKTKWWEVNR